MYFLVLEDSGGLYLFGLFITFLLCVSEISNRYMCIVWFTFCGYLVYIGEILEILVNLQISLIFSQISPLYIVKSVKSLLFVIYLFWFPLSNLCVQVSGCWLQEKRGRDHYNLYLFCETNNSSAYVIHLHCTLYISIRIQFLDLFLWSGFPIWFTL